MSSLKGSFIKGSKASVYAEVAEKYGWVPTDVVAAKLMGATQSHIIGTRQKLQGRYDFEKNGHGWNVTPKPQPEPEPEPIIEPLTLVERIKQRLGLLPQDDLVAIDQLLQEATDK